METIKGYLRYPVELNFTSSGIAVCRFTLYDTEKKQYKIKYPCVAWEELAEACHNKLTETDLLYCKGYFKLREWINDKGEQVRQNQFTAKDIYVEVSEGQFANLADNDFRNSWT